MHLALVMVGGIVLLGLFQLFAWLWTGAGNWTYAALLFLPAWLIIAIINMWVGVTRAGYSVRQELPILLLVVAVPTACALLIFWRFGR